MGEHARARPGSTHPSAAPRHRGHAGRRHHRRRDHRVPEPAVGRARHDRDPGAGAAPVRPLRMGRLDPLGDVGRALLRLGRPDVLQRRHLHVQAVPGRGRGEVHGEVLRRVGDRVQGVLSAVALAPFALTRVESSRLARSLTSGSSGRLSAHLAGPDDDAALLSLQLTGSVFLEAFGNTPELLHREYAELLRSMTHAVVLDKVAQAPVGALILQEGPAASLKTVVDLAAPPWSFSAASSLFALDLAPHDRTAADLLVMAVDREFRNRSIAQLLMYAGWVASVARGIDRWTAILDDGLLRGLDQLTAGAVVPLASSAPYLGSPGSTPITVRMHPDEDGDLLSRVQRVGRLAERTMTFCARLEPDRLAFQSLSVPAFSAA